MMNEAKRVLNERREGGDTKAEEAPREADCK